MITYSRYRDNKHPMSEGHKALIYAACIAFLWAWASEMDYREIEQTRCERSAT